MLNLLKKLKSKKHRLQETHFYSIIQMGKERSLIQSESTNKIYMVDNQYLMTLDEKGMIL